MMAKLGYSDAEIKRQGVPEVLQAGESHQVAGSEENNGPHGISQGLELDFVAEPDNVKC